MQLPTLDPDTLFLQLLQDLPDHCLLLARQFKAFTRSRKVQSPADLLRLVLLYCGEDLSLRQVAGHFTLLKGQPISDTAIKKRLLAASAWLKALLPHLLHQCSLPPGNRRFLVSDSTSVVAPGAKGTHYRIHLTLNLLTLEFIALTITDKHTTESLLLVPLTTGDVVLADRFYARRDHLIDAHQRGAQVIVRHHPKALPIYQENGERLNLLEQLSQQAQGSIQSFSGYIVARDGRRLRVYLHSYRLSDKAAASARRKVRYERRKSQNGAKPETLFYAGFVMILTTIAPEEIGGEEIMKVYGCRWQIEVAIKRWKSLLDVDELRARYQSDLAELWLNGKMIYALLIERRSKRLSGQKLEYMDEERKRSWWRLWGVMRQEVSSKVIGSQNWQAQAWSQCVEAMSERKRERKLQRLPDQAIDYLRSSKELDGRLGMTA